MTTLLDTSKDAFRTLNDEMRRQIVQQIGVMNLLAISGGRVIGRPTGLWLPVGSGYHVTVDLDANDTYVVRRLFKRAGKIYLKGERTDVYAEDLSECAYYASCYVSYDDKEWPQKR